MLTSKTNNTKPYSLEAEQQIIGSLLIDNASLQDVYGNLKAEMFYDEIFRNAYQICQDAFDENKTFDMVYLADRLKDKLEKADDEVFEAIRGCVLNTQTSVNIRNHAETVIKKHTARQIEKALSKVKNSPDEAVNVLESLYNGVLSDNNDSKSQCNSLADITGKYKDDYFCEKESTQLKSGISAFDEVIGEFEGGDLIVIGARPAVGKSALASQIVNNLSHKGAKIGYFNLEMTEKQVFERFIATESGIGLTRIRRALRFMNDEEEKYKAAVERLEKKDKIIIPTGSKTVSQIRMIVKKEKFDIVVVDYLQLVKAENRYRGNRFAEVGEISHSLKAIATEFEIPVIVLTQLNRVSEGKSNKEPTMAEIRESGDIEQDASIILLLWNKDDDDRSKKGYKFDKNRQGTLKKGELRFDGERMKFCGEDDDDFHEVDDFNIPFDV